MQFGYEQANPNAVVDMPIRSEHAARRDTVSSVSGITPKGT